jgi:glycosyltransferase involved in cell wall biosynthesis
MLRSARATNDGSCSCRPVEGETRVSNEHFRVLFLIENVPYELDTRVRRQAHALQSAGGSATVICPGPAGRGGKRRDGVRVYHYPKPSLGGGFVAHLAEYVSSLFFHTLLTAWVALRHGFDVIHVANPPDLLWLVAAPYRLLGKRFIFDHHDLVPELFAVRFAARLPRLARVMLAFERCSVQLADHVISTNETFRRMAIERDGKAPDAVTVVRNGPWLQRDFPDVTPDARVRGFGRIVVGYLGIMNDQDHLDHLLEAARIVRFELGRRDVAFLLIGSGDAHARLLRQRDALSLTDAVHMPGTLPWSDVLACLSAVDICVQPDPPTAFNRHLTMNKLMEYMALGKPSIAFDMPETRFSGGDAVVYVAGDSAAALAAAIVALADDPERREALGRRARQRIETSLAWEHQAGNLLDVYRRVLPAKIPAPVPQKT